MNRLLQGEVGSGKTVVVLITLLAAIARGYQGSIMVPTEVLAEQHFQTVARLLGGMADTTQAENLLTVYLEALGRPLTVGLLTGSTRARPRRRLTGMASEGTLDLLIGTHALIQEGVEIPRLALAVMDEQHRFGVMQRSALRQKSDENPHTLVMSATPIPRTLQLTFYGDLDISTIDELPPGRQEILTRYVEPERREAAYGFISREIQAGRQAFIVCPLIEESEVIEAKAAADEHQRLSKEVFPDLKLGLLHGRMSSAEKDKVMRRFRDGETDILVTTAVVEVGIDVPNATVMLIEGADRFGLSSCTSSVAGWAGASTRATASSCRKTRPNWPRSDWRRWNVPGMAFSWPRLTWKCGALAISSAPARAACPACGWPSYRTEICWTWRGTRLWRSLRGIRSWPWRNMPL